jgi:hypothetical protein
LPVGLPVPIVTPAEGLTPGATPRLAATGIDIVELMTTAWRIFYRNMGICIAAALLLAIISAAINQGLGRLGENPPRAVFPRFDFVFFHGPWWVGPVEALVNSLLFSGQAIFFLKIARGQRAGITDLFTGWHWALQAFLAAFIVGLVITLGIILCVVPGIIAALMFWPTLYFVVDRNAGALEAMDFSRDVTNGNKLYLFLLGIVVGILALLSVIPCGLGLIFFLPWLGVLGAVTYLRLSGQPVAEEGLRPQATDYR